ncbi:MAG: hypothetical protein JRE73_09020 [Deltaproteobacteria bacterium]|nr:hypothetical protein [Deltaproteobacteria bacterium]
MKKRQILWAIVFGSMLAITGCGDGGSTAKGSCETICDSPCQLFGLVDPASPTCLSDCTDVGYDSCVPETTALVACAEGVQGGDCTIDPNIPCEAEGDAWSACP